VIVTSCPLRISLVGGSTDHPEFLNRYGYGSVISFPSNLRTYVTIHKDVFGANSIDQNFILNYSRREVVKHLYEIKNELIRICFQDLDVKQINCSLTSDIYSAGSGLAASSAYLQALVKSIYVMRNEFISEFEVCKIAESIERKFNPLVGQQDFFGSMGGFKLLKFYKNSDPEIRYLSTRIFLEMEMYLLYTGILRNSTQILQSIDHEKSKQLLDDVKDLEQAIEQNNLLDFNDIINRAWYKKKQTSSEICANDKLQELDLQLSRDQQVLSHKLCGAGNGGYFLIFTKSGSCLDTRYNMIKRVTVSETGLKWINLQHEFTKL